MKTISKIILTLLMMSALLAIGCTSGTDSLEDRYPMVKDAAFQIAGKNTEVSLEHDLRRLENATDGRVRYVENDGFYCGNQKTEEILVHSNTGERGCSGCGSSLYVLDCEDSYWVRSSYDSGTFLYGPFIKPNAK